MTWTIILPLVGVIIGATLSPFVTAHFARTKEREERKKEAYSAFVSAIAALANKDSNPALADALRRANLEIMVHGSRRVLEAVAGIMPIKDLGKPEARPAFTKVLIAMRRDTGADPFSGEDTVIEDIVFGEKN